MKTFHPTAFLLGVFAATATTPETLAVVSHSLSKRNYDEWLNQQPGN